MSSTTGAVRIAERTGASLNRGNSRQDYGTPRVFLDAVEARFGELQFDLAATAENAVTTEYYDENINALSSDWAANLASFVNCLAWLNPPFADIAPWAERCARFSSPRLRILLLVPASVGSNWFAEHVHKKAVVLGLSPRLTFVGMKDPYPKDLILCAFGFGCSGFDLWRWK